MIELNCLIVIQLAQLLQQVVPHICTIQWNSIFIKQGKRLMQELHVFLPLYLAHLAKQRRQGKGCTVMPDKHAWDAFQGEYHLNIEATTFSLHNKWHVYIWIGHWDP